MSPKSTSTALAVIAPAAFGDYAIDTRLVSKAAVPYISYAELKADSGAPIAEEEQIRILIEGGFNSAEEAFAKMFGVFGMSRFASKPGLAGYDVDEVGNATRMRDPIAFRIEEIVMLEKGGFKNKSDAWLLKIITSNGEPQQLTFERNEGRDKFLFFYAAVLQAFPRAGDWVTLERVEKEDGTGFYLITPVRAVRSSGVEVIDAAYREVAK